MIESSEIGRPIAHRRSSDGATHDLEEHLRSAALLAGRFAEAWGASETAALAALWHDLGKYAPEFQAMIRSVDPEAHLEGVATGPRQRVNHSSAGALWAMERFRDSGFGRLLAYTIAGHHSGLPDWIREAGTSGLKDRLADRSHLTRTLAAKPPRPILDAPLPSRGIPKDADAGLWVRMFASALFDADFLDTEAFFQPACSPWESGLAGRRLAAAEARDAFGAKSGRGRTDACEPAQSRSSARLSKCWGPSARAVFVDGADRRRKDIVVASFCARACTPVWTASGNIRNPVHQHHRANR
jgi:CRISPR-associated endonuclease Cas3-HD